MRRELQIHIVACRRLDTKKSIWGRVTLIANLCLNLSIFDALRSSSHFQAHLAQLLALCLDPLLFFKVRSECCSSVRPLLVKLLRSLHVRWIENVTTFDGLLYYAWATCKCAQCHEMLRFLGTEFLLCCSELGHVIER